MISMRLPPPVSVVHSAIAANVAKFGLLGPPLQPTGPRGCSWASGYDPQSPILFVVLSPLLPALDNKPRLAQKPDLCVGILVAEKTSR
jgi:hypothetical protein